MVEPITPRSRVRAAIRQLWLRSRERAQALKDAKYTCKKCGRKQSKKKGFEQKVEVHHIHGIGNWDKVIDLILDEILCDPAQLEVLCPDCHDKETTAQLDDGFDADEFDPPGSEEFGGRR